MPPKNRIPTHPGVILREDFLRPLGVSQVAFAAHIGVPLQRVNEIVMSRITQLLIDKAGDEPSRGQMINENLVGAPAGGELSIRRQRSRIYRVD